MKKKKEPIIYFTETQNIQRFWIRIFLLFEIIFFSAIIYRQLFLGKLFGPYPVTNSGLVILSLLLTIPAFVLFFVKIKITVSSKNIRYKMIPSGLFQYRIAREQLKGFSLETKKSYSSHKTAGLQLKLKNGSTLFLPSQKPEQLLEAVQKMMHTN